MKAILMSIKPKWCELIASGKKTIEVRKTRPKIDTPFKCYIYETKGETETPWADEDGHLIFRGRGQVIGEFVCKQIDYIEAGIDTNLKYIIHGYYKAFLNGATCLTDEELWEYLYKSHENRGGWAWHISDLKIYDEPKSLFDFGLKRAPQSWCHVEKGEQLI